MHLFRSSLSQLAAKEYMSEADSASREMKLGRMQFIQRSISKPDDFLADEPTEKIP